MTRPQHLTTPTQHNPRNHENVLYSVSSQASEHFPVSFHDNSRRSGHNLPPVPVYPSPPSSRPQRPHIIVPHFNDSRPDIASRPPSSCPTPTSIGAISPILFASPTLSSHGVSSPLSDAIGGRPTSYSYSNSPSWETSYGSESNDYSMLRAGSLPRSASPSSYASPIGHSPLGDRGIGRGLTDDTPPIDLGPHTLPMLTLLSLPGSANTSAYADTNFGSPLNPIANPQPSQEQGNAPWTLSLSLPTPSPSESLPTSLSLPLSPVSSYQGRLEDSPRVNADEMRVIAFPSPSPSRFSLPSVLSSPMSGLSVLNNIAGETGAVEYATALMSSAWGPDNPVGVVLRSGPDEDGGTGITEPDAYDRDQAQDFGANHQYLSQSRALPRRGVLGKVKQLGVTVKRFFAGRTGRRIIQRAEVTNTSNPFPERSEVPADIITTENPDNLQSCLPPTDPDTISFNRYTPLPLPAPPGLAVRLDHIIRHGFSIK